ncbi:hypothetical protein CerSpe_102990 [Prunus speciosa]
MHGKTKQHVWHGDRSLCNLLESDRSQLLGDRSPAASSSFFFRPRICFETTGRFSLVTGRLFLHLHTKCEPILQHTLHASESFPKHVLRNVSSNRVTVESDVPVSATLRVSVD